MWSFTVIIFKLGRSIACRSKMIDAAKHHVLDTLEVLVERDIGFVYFNRVADVDPASLLGGQLCSQGVMESSTQMVTIFW